MPDKPINVFLRKHERLYEAVEQLETALVNVEGENILMFASDGDGGALTSLYQREKDKELYDKILNLIGIISRK